MKITKTIKSRPTQIRKEINKQPVDNKNCRTNIQYNERKIIIILIIIIVTKEEKLFC